MHLAACAAWQRPDKGAPWLPSPRPLLPAAPSAAYDSVSGTPVYNTFLVARSLDTGAVEWTQNMTGMTGPSKLPVSPPTINLGVASAVTAQGLMVMDAGSGQMRYTLAEGKGRGRRRCPGQAGQVAQQGARLCWQPHVFGLNVFG